MQLTRWRSHGIAVNIIPNTLPMTPQQKLSIVMASWEVDPFSKLGGLGDVSRSLSKALKRRGHDVCVITPLWATIEKKQLKKILSDKKLIIDKSKTITYNVWRGFLMHDLPVYFIEEGEFVSKSKKFYGTGRDNARLLIYNLCALDALEELAIKPSIINCHDWQAGLMPYFLTHRHRKNEFFKNTATVFTIHNLIFQMGQNWWEIAPEKKDNGRGKLPSFSDNDAIEHINFTKRAIRNADMINAVSEQYAKEIMTKKFGQELHRILRNRKDDVVGIVNGIDYNEWNPSKDPGLLARYDYNSLHNKTKNKIWLQEQLGVTVDPRIPLIAWTSRLTEQKGIELVMDIIEPLMRLDVQLVFLGVGQKEYEKFFKKYARKYPKKLVARSPYVQTTSSSFTYDRKQETRLLAGADMLIMPSRYEPCGLPQLKSLRYGAIPIVHKVGGLADTVINYQTRTNKGTGFVFTQYDSRDLLVAVVRALENHKHRDTWLQLVRRAMQQSFSWEIPARKYEELFYRAFRKKETLQ